MKQTHASGLIEINIAVMLFGIAGLFGKFLPLPAWTIVLGRTGFATLVLGLVMIFTKNRGPQKGGGGVFLFGLLGLVLAIHWITFFHAIQISSVAVGLLAFSTFPVFITWLEPWWFKERRRWIDVVTALTVLLGVSIMVYPSPFGGQIYTGVGWGAVSGLTFAILSLLNRKWVQHYPPVVIAFYQNAVASLLLLPLVAWIDVSINSVQLGLLAILGIVCTGLSHVLFIRGLTIVRAQLASIIACLEPVYGIMLAYFLLNETPSRTTFVGGALILMTTMIAMMRRA